MHAISNAQFEFCREVLKEYYDEHSTDDNLRKYNRARRASLLLRAFAKNKELENNTLLILT